MTKMGSEGDIVNGNEKGKAEEPMFDYQKPDRGWCGDPERGAAMGRTSDLSHDTTVVLRMRRVPLDEGGYDPGGTYWGTPDDLFCVFDADGAMRYLRAGSLDEVRAEFPRASWASETGPSEADIADMLDGYIACALWSSNDESNEYGGEPLDANYVPDDLADEARAEMRADVESFGRANGAVIASCIGKGERCDWSHAGHDLWLTRNHHGCGFWDGDWPKAEGKALTKAADAMGEVHLYVGDDGKIYGE